MTEFATLTVDKEAKLLIKQTQKIIHDKTRVDFDLKDLVYLIFRRPEKAVDLVNENFQIEMTETRREVIKK